MYTLSIQPLDSSMNLLQVGLGTDRFLRENLSENKVTSPIGKLVTRITIRILWFQISKKLKFAVKHSNAATDLIRKMDSRSLSSADYKTLRLQKERTQEYLDKFTAIRMPLGQGPSWMHKPLTDCLVALQNYLTALDHLFDSNDIKVNSVKGFRIISQDEAWESRTTAYDYAT